PSRGPWVPDLRSLTLARPGHETGAPLVRDTRAAHTRALHISTARAADGWNAVVLLGLPHKKLREDAHALDSGIRSGTARNSRRCADVRGCGDHLGHGRRPRRRGAPRRV